MTKQRKNFSGHCRLCGKWKVNGHKGDWRKQTRLSRKDWEEIKRRYA